MERKSLSTIIKEKLIPKIRIVKKFNQLLIDKNFLLNGLIETSLKLGMSKEDKGMYIKFASHTYKELGNKILEFLKHNNDSSGENVKPDIWVKNVLIEKINRKGVHYNKNMIDTSFEKKEGYTGLIPGDIIWYPCVSSPSESIIKEQNTYHFGIYIGCGAIVHKMWQTASSEDFVPSRFPLYRALTSLGDKGGVVLLSSIKSFTASDHNNSCEKGIYVLDPFNAKEVLNLNFYPQPNRLIIIENAINSLGISNYGIRKQHCQHFALSILFDTCLQTKKLLPGRYFQFYPEDYEEFKESSLKYISQRGGKLNYNKQMKQIKKYSILI